MMIDAEAQLRVFIKYGTLPEVPIRRLVLRLTARVADPDRQAELNELLNAELKRLEDEPWHRDRALVLLQQVVAAGGN